MLDTSYVQNHPTNPDAAPLGSSASKPNPLPLLLERDNEYEKETSFREEENADKQFGFDSVLSKGGKSKNANFL